MLKTVKQQLNTSLTSLKVRLGEKKFKKKIKKAAKKLVEGVKKKISEKGCHKIYEGNPCKEKSSKSCSEKIKAANYFGCSFIYFCAMRSGRKVNLFLI